MADRNDKSIPTLVSELWQLTVTYLKQETIVPIKSLGRFVAFGFTGAFLLSVACLLLLLGGLRALQTETGDTFQGGWSFGPYLITLVVAGVVAGIAASRIGKGNAKGSR